MCFRLFLFMKKAEIICHKGWEIRVSGRRMISITPQSAPPYEYATLTIEGEEKQYLSMWNTPFLWLLWHHFFSMWKRHSRLCVSARDRMIVFSKDCITSWDQEIHTRVKRLHQKKRGEKNIRNLQGRIATVSRQESRGPGVTELLTKTEHFPSPTSDISTASDARLKPHNCLAFLYYSLLTAKRPYGKEITLSRRHVMKYEI